MVRPLLVTDPGLADMPMVKDALAANAGRRPRRRLFLEHQAQPGRLQHRRGRRRLSRGGNHDGVIAFGGGSALDVGKVIAFMSGQSRPLWDFEDKEDWWSRADAAGIAPVIAVPTTAGTGSEVGRAGVILDEAEGTKKIIFHPRDDAGGRHLGPGAHRRPSAARHRRHRHGRAFPLHRSLLRARLPPDGRRHRRRGHEADPRWLRAP